MHRMNGNFDARNGGVDHPLSDPILSDQIRKSIKLPIGGQIYPDAPPLAYALRASWAAALFFQAIRIVIGRVLRDLTGAAAAAALDQPGRIAGRPPADRGE
jgi:hypothetical protein